MKDCTGGVWTGGGCEHFVIKGGEFRDKFSDYQLLQNECASCTDMCMDLVLNFSGIAV